MLLESQAPRLREKAAAAHVALSPHTLRKLRVTGGGPEFIKCGRAVIYSLADLDAWLNAKRRRSTSDNGGGE
jgi:hypothetical protein